MLKTKNLGPLWSILCINIERKEAYTGIMRLSKERYASDLLMQIGDVKL